MGLYSSMRRCITNENCIAPNPNPDSYTLLRKEVFDNATLLKVHYTGCTNFEGIKLLVFIGDFTPKGTLDPHFADSKLSPIARFKPTEEGLTLARLLCKSI